MALIDSLIAAQGGKRKTTKRSYYQPLYGEQPRNTVDQLGGMPSTAPLTAPASAPSVLTPPPASTPPPRVIDMGLPSLSADAGNGLADSLVTSMNDLGPAKPKPKTMQPDINDRSVVTPGASVDPWDLGVPRDYAADGSFNNIKQPDTSVPVPAMPTYGSDNPANVMNPGQDAENRRILDQAKSDKAVAVKEGLLPGDAGFDTRSGKFTGPDIVDPSKLADPGGVAINPNLKGTDLVSRLLQMLFLGGAGSSNGRMRP